MTVEIVTVDAESPSPKIIERAARLILQGDVIVCPTDTGYAFAAGNQRYTRGKVGKARICNLIAHGKTKLF